MDRTCFWCFETCCRHWQFQVAHLLQPNRGNGQVCVLQSKDVGYRIFSKDIGCSFSTGKILSFTPGGVASFNPLFSTSLLTTSLSTTMIRETLSLADQRFATCPWIKRPSIRHPTIVINFSPFICFSVGLRVKCMWSLYSPFSFKDNDAVSTFLEIAVRNIKAIRLDQHSRNVLDYGHWHRQSLYQTQISLSRYPLAPQLQSHRRKRQVVLLSILLRNQSFQDYLVEADSVPQFSIKCRSLQTPVRIPFRCVSARNLCP